MKKTLAGILAVVSLTATSHTQSPGRVENLKAYKEVNGFEFTLVNKSPVVATYAILIGDFDPVTQGMVDGTEKKIGNIADMAVDEGVRFNVNFNVAPGTTQVSLMCTELDIEDVAYKSRVCSKIILKRR